MVVRDRPGVGYSEAFRVGRRLEGVRGFEM